jgi:hypothetical protein
MHDHHPPAHIFNIMTINNIHTKASNPFVYVVLTVFPSPATVMKQSPALVLGTAA